MANAVSVDIADNDVVAFGGHGGLKEVVAFYSKIADHARAWGKSQADIDRLINQVQSDLARNPLTNSFGYTPEQLRKIREEFEKIDKARRNNQQQKKPSPLETFPKVIAQFSILRNQVKRFFDTFDGIAKVNQGLRNMAQSAGLTAGKFLQMAAAEKMMGGSGSGTAGLFGKFESTMANAVRGGGFGQMQEAAWKYGLFFHPNQSAEDYELTIASAMKGMKSERDRIGLAQTLGISPSSEQFTALKMGPEYIKKMRAEMERYNKTTEEAQEALKAYNQAQGRLSAALQNIKNKMFIAIAPLLNWLRDVCTGFLNLIDGFEYIGGVLDVLFAAIMSLTAIVGIIKLFQLLKAAIMSLSAIKGIFAIFPKLVGLLTWMSTASFTLSGAMHALAAGMASFWATLVPLLPVIGAIALAVGGIILAVRSWIDMMDTLDSVGASFWDGLVESVKHFGTFLKAFIAHLVPNWLGGAKVREWMGVEGVTKEKIVTKGSADPFAKAQGVVRELRKRGYTEEEIEEYGRTGNLPPKGNVYSRLGESTASAAASVVNETHSINTVNNNNHGGSRNASVNVTFNGRADADDIYGTVKNAVADGMEVAGQTVAA